MKKRYLLIAISMILVQGCYTAPPYESSSYGSGYSGVSIGIQYSTYPDLVRIPGYPVYYAPRVDSNYFFYDGLYWVFHSDNWYVSSWYNGPWDYVGYYDVPAYLLRVPVRYYRLPPPYFRGWRADAPPRWGIHWGRDWEQRRRGWDRWDRSSAPAPAPLPVYQRDYPGDRYPRAVEQQHRLRSEHYRYQPREPVTQQYFKPRAQQDQQRRQDQQRQLEQQQRQQERQRQLEQQRRQDQQRQLEPQRQQDLQRQRDIERQRSQPEPRSKARDDKVAPQGPVQKDKEAQQEYERRKKEYEERYQNR